MNSPIILAIDTKELETAKNWVSATRESIGVYKIGLEFFLKFGEAGFIALKAAGAEHIFLDLKLHDIPNTVSAAVLSVAKLTPKFLTVHASGGSQMVRAAADAAPGISITAVTVLTSLSNEDLKEIGYASDSLNSAVKLAKLAVTAGARSIVCSPFEVEEIRKNVPNNIELITPGVRPEGSAKGDQKRVMTPKQALDAGANYLVIGRPITDFAKESMEAMKNAAKNILNSVSN